MTYNVFGGTLSLTQSSLEDSYSSKIQQAYNCPFTAVIHTR